MAVLNKSQSTNPKNITANDDPGNIPPPCTDGSSPPTVPPRLHRIPFGAPIPPMNPLTDSDSDGQSNAKVLGDTSYGGVHGNPARGRQDTLGELPVTEPGACPTCSPPSGLPPHHGRILPPVGALPTGRMMQEPGSAVMKGESGEK